MPFIQREILPIDVGKKNQINNDNESNHYNSSETPCQPQQNYER